MENYSILEGPQLGLSGTVQSWEVINSDGSIARACYKPHSNLITNYGLESLYLRNNSGGWGSYAWDVTKYIAIGTGTAEPTITDTRLGTEVFRGERNYDAYNADSYSPAGGVDGYYYVTRTRGYQTNLGDLNNDVSEIGFSPDPTPNGASLFSKHRLKDEYGNPTSIRVNSDQQLRIKYIVSISVTPITTYTGSFELSGYTPTTINYTAGWQSCSQFDFVANTTWQSLNMYFFSTSASFNPIGAAASVVSTPTKVSQSTASLSSDLSGGYYVLRDYTISTSQCTWPTGIAGVAINCYTPGAWTYVYSWWMNISPPIIKPDTHRMTLRMKFSWGRAT